MNEVLGEYKIIRTPWNCEHLTGQDPKHRDSWHSDRRFCDIMIGEHGEEQCDKGKVICCYFCDEYACCNPCPAIVPDGGDFE